MLATLNCVFLVAGVLVALDSQDSLITTVAPEVARQHAVKIVNPRYPPIAEAAKVQSVVRLEVVISASGVPERIVVVRGNPLLNQAAIEALREWRFAPFTGPDGSPMAVKSAVEFLFADEKTRTRVAELMPAYRKLTGECATLVGSGRAAEAITACDAALDVATRMALGPVHEQQQAAGRARVLAGQLREALPFYQAVLQDLRRLPFPSGAKALAFMDVARVQRDLKDLSNAARSYDEAAKEFRRVANERADALKRVKSEAKDGESQVNDVHLELVRASEEAVTGLRASLGEYVNVLRQLGKTGDAAKVEKQLAEVTAGKL